MNFLENFYCSGVNPQEEIGLPAHIDYQCADQKHATAETTLYKTFSAEQKELYYDVCRKFAIKANYEDARRFSYAFRLGCQVMCEVSNPID